MTINGRKKQTDLSESHRDSCIQTSFIKEEQFRSTPAKSVRALALVCFRSCQGLINLALYCVLSLGERLNR